MSQQNIPKTPNYTVNPTHNPPLSFMLHPNPITLLQFRVCPLELVVKCEVLKVTLNLFPVHFKDRYKHLSQKERKVSTVFSLRYDVSNESFRR